MLRTAFKRRLSLARRVGILTCAYLCVAERLLTLRWDNFGGRAHRFVLRPSRALNGSCFGLPRIVLAADSRRVQEGREHTDRIVSEAHREKVPSRMGIGANDCARSWRCLQERQVSAVGIQPPVRQANWHDSGVAVSAVVVGQSAGWPAACALVRAADGPHQAVTRAVALPTDAAAGEPGSSPTAHPPIDWQRRRSLVGRSSRNLVWYHRSCNSTCSLAGRRATAGLARRDPPQRATAIERS